MNRKSKPRILKASLVLLASLFLGSWLWAQKEPAPPAPTAPAVAPAATPSQTEEMLRALRRAMTNAPRTTNPAASPTNTTLSTATNRPPSLSAPAPSFPSAPGSPSTSTSLPTNRATVSPGSPATPTAATSTSAPTNNTTVIAPVVIGAPVGVPASPGPGAPAPVPSAAAAATGGLQPVPSRPPSVVPAAPGATLPQPAVPAGQPAFPSLPGQVATPPPQTAPVPASAPAADELLPPTVIQAQGMALDQFFELYSMISGRTVLRPYELTGAAKGITLKAQTDWTREEAIFAMDSALALNGIAMIPVSEKFVKAVLAQSAPTEGSELVKVEPAPGSQAEQFITQIVELKVVKPSEIAQLLATFSKIPNSITPFDNNNTIVLREYGSNVKRMLEVIRKVDVERESDYKLEVIPIRYGKVTDLYNTMGSLISGQPSSAGGSTTTQRTGGTRGGLGRAGSGGGGLRGNQRNQTGMVNPMQQQPVQPVTAGGAQSSFQNRLQQIVSRAAGGAEVELLQEARIVPDERSNTLLIFANKRDIEMITNIVAKVDVLLAQVLIEAIILEVKLNDSQNVGVSMLQQPKRFGNDLSGVGGINNGPQFLSGVTNLAGSMPSGFSYFGKIGDDMDFAVTALARDSNVKVTSRPRVQTSHGIPGDFIITEQVPYVSALNDYGGFGGFGGSSALTRSQVEYLDIGVELYVTPYITPDGYVVMDINQTFSQRGPDVIIDGNPFPSLNNRETTSTLTVRDGDTIMMGGFITDSKNRAKSGVPFLKDVPLLGALFRSKSSSTDRTELIVLMRATVLENPRQAALVADKERQQLPGIQAAEQEFKAIEEKHRRKGERSRRK